MYNNYPIQPTRSAGKSYRDEGTRVSTVRKTAAYLSKLMLLLFLGQQGYAQSPLSGSASAGSIPCEGGSTTLTITASGGTPPYEYSINNGSTYQAGNTFTVSANTYSQIKVRDNVADVASVASITVDDGPPGPSTNYYVDADGDG
ncbi:MAG: SprB repeat-containing protein, partial [Bacteroidota bacterium]